MPCAGLECCLACKRIRWMWSSWLYRKQKTIKQNKAHALPGCTARVLCGIQFVSLWKR